MRKKIVGLGLTVITVAILVYLTCFSDHSVRFTDCFVDAQGINAIISERQEAEESLLDSISFNEYDLILDKEENKLYYSLIQDDCDAYDPYIAFSGTSPTVRLVVQNTEISDGLISSAEEIRIVAYTDSQYSEYSLVCTTLPLVNLSCTEEIGDKDISIHFSLFDNRAGATQRVTDSDGKIHIRGGSSKYFAKKGYKISLQQESLGANTRENDVSLLGMRQDGDWILYAAYNDQEKVRNVFSSEIWYDSCADNNVFGIENGMKYEYVELFINDRYWGLYALGFPIDAHQEQLTPGEYLYQKTQWWKPLDVDLTSFDEWKSYFEVTYKGALAAEDVWVPLRRYYMMLQNMPEARSEAYDFMDMNNAVDAFLFFNLIQGVDNVQVGNSKNIKFIYKNTDCYEKLLYVPWDLDQTWGNVWGNSEKNWIRPYGVSAESNVIMGLNPVWFLLQSGDSEIKAQVAERYAELRNGDWSQENIGKIIDKYESCIFDSGAYARDQARWPDGTYLEDSSVKLNLFREYVSQRLQYLDAYVEEITK